LPLAEPEGVVEHQPVPLPVADMLAARTLKQPARRTVERADATEWRTHTIDGDGARILEVGDGNGGDAGAAQDEVGIPVRDAHPGIEFDDHIVDGEAPIHVRPVADDA